MDLKNADGKNSFQHIQNENNDSSTVSTHERVPSRNSERSKRMKKKKSTSSLGNRRESPVPGLSALTPIHKHWNRVSSADRPHLDGSFKSSIRKITHMSISSRSRHSQSPTSEDEAELVAQENSSIITTVPTVEVQIPETAIGSLDYQTFDDPDLHDGQDESPDLAIVSANKPGSSPEIRRMRSKRKSHARKTPSTSSSKTTSNSLDPSDRGLIINRSRPNSRSSFYAYSERQPTAKKSYDSDETLYNRGMLEKDEHKDYESSETSPPGQPDRKLVIKTNSNGQRLEENLDNLAMTDKPAIAPKNNDRILLPSQRSQATVYDLPNKIGPMTCRGALHSLSCEHLKMGFHSMETALTKTNNDVPVTANNPSANTKDQENLQAETELQPAESLTIGTQNLQQPPSTGSTICVEEIQQSCVQCNTAILREKVNGDSKRSDNKQRIAQQMPKYDDWEESSIEETNNYRQCDPNEFF